MPCHLSLPEPTRAFLDDLPLEHQAGRFLHRQADGTVVADWYGCELSSVFQPIVDPAQGTPIGHEAFLRCLGDGDLDLSPWNLFSAPANDQRLIELDRLTRTLHTLNHLVAGVFDGLLFLNVHGRLLAAVSHDHGAAFRRVADALGVPPERIVIETPLAASHQPDLLAFVLRNYRLHGFQVAVNVESPAQWQNLSPGVPAQFIKIDAQHIATLYPAAKRLEWLAALSVDAPVIVTRLEHPWPGPLPGGVLVQGYAYGRPKPPVPAIDSCLAGTP